MTVRQFLNRLFKDEEAETMRALVGLDMFVQLYGHLYTIERVTLDKKLNCIILSDRKEVEDYGL